MSDWEALTALAEESQTLSAVLLDLDAEEFKRPTNCPPWDLKELVVHTAASIGLRDDFRSPDPGAPLRSAADYYRRPERATPEYRDRNVDDAQDLAARLPAGITAAAMFEQLWRETVAELGDHPGPPRPGPGRGSDAAGRLDGDPGDLGRGARGGRCADAATGAVDHLLGADRHAWGVRVAAGSWAPTMAGLGRPDAAGDRHRADAP